MSESVPMTQWTKSHVLRFLGNPLLRAEYEAEAASMRRPVQPSR